METSEKKKGLKPYLIYATIFTVIGLAFAFLGKELLPYRLGTFQGGVVCAACFISAITDYKQRKILNVVTYPSFLLLLFVQTLVLLFPEDLANRLGYWENGLSGLKDSFSGLAFCFALFFTIYACFGRGAGDAKLASVIGFGLGLRDAIGAIAATYIAVFFYLISKYLMRCVYRLAKRIFSKNDLEVVKENPGEALLSETNKTIDVNNLDPTKSMRWTAISWIILRIRAFMAKCRKVLVPMGIGFFVGTTGVVMGVWQTLIDIIIARLQ